MGHQKSNGRTKFGRCLFSMNTKRSNPANPQDLLVLRKMRQQICISLGAKLVLIPRWVTNKQRNLSYGRFLCLLEILKRSEPRKSAGFACFAQDRAANLLFYGRKTGSDSPMGHQKRQITQRVVCLLLLSFGMSNPMKKYARRGRSGREIFFLSSRGEVGVRSPRCRASVPQNFVQHYLPPKP